MNDSKQLNASDKLFKIRLSADRHFVEYINPIKTGITVWVRANATNSFVPEFQVFTGKQVVSPEKTLGYIVVHDLTRKLVGKHVCRLHLPKVPSPTNVSSPLSHLVELSSLLEVLLSSYSLRIFHRPFSCN